MCLCNAHTTLGRHDENASSYGTDTRCEVQGTELEKNTKDERNKKVTVRVKVPDTYMTVA